jgi:hypothetical protein
MHKSLRIASGPFSPCSLAPHSFLPRTRPLPLVDGVLAWDFSGWSCRDTPCTRGIDIFIEKPLVGMLVPLCYLMMCRESYIYAMPTVYRHVSLRQTLTAGTSLNRLKGLGIPIEDQLAKINSCLADIDQLLIPSTINNCLNQRFVMRKEARALSVLLDYLQKQADAAEL